MGCQERELFLAPCQLLVGTLAFSFKRLAHPHKGDVEAALKHSQCLIDGRLRKSKLLGAFLRDLRCGIAPPQTPLGDFVQRRGPLRGKLGEYAPGLFADLASDARSLTGHPASHGDRRDHADSLEALLDDGIEHLP